VSFLSQPLSFFSIGPTRSFGGISGYVTISESASDTVTITKQPIQQGAAISDHAFKNPVSFSIQISFADAGFLPSLFGGKSLPDIYQELLALQSSFVPFNCVTPKRTYYNMLFAALGQTTDKKTENVLAINATFEEVIIVPVASTNIPRSQLRNPGSNGGNQNAGKKSALLTLTQGIGAAFK
jgi:hypothetical protein